MYIKSPMKNTLTKKSPTSDHTQIPKAQKKSIKTGNSSFSLSFTQTTSFFF